jgi:hypothetical protein
VQIAWPGSPVAESPGWPAGVADLVNDPTRTSGWNSWFSEWPNDVNQYGFEIAKTDDLNRLIGKLAAIKSGARQIRLSYLEEPRSLGWVTRLPEDNKVTVIFSIGNQSQIDQWYKRVRKPFGRMEFVAAPVAVPPTLTIFVQNDWVDLDALQIPQGIAVEAGYVPTVFHLSNTKIEKGQEAAAAERKKVTGTQPQALAPAEQAAADKIAAFLKRRADRRTSP